VISYDNIVCRCFAKAGILAMWLNAWFYVEGLDLSFCSDVLVFPIFWHEESIYSFICSSLGRKVQFSQFTISISWCPIVNNTAWLNIFHLSALTLLEIAHSAPIARPLLVQELAKGQLSPSSAESGSIGCAISIHRSSMMLNKMLVYHPLLTSKQWDFTH
jgi:hypothetical protein